NGVIVFVFPQDRHLRVEVGYGVEPALPDVEVLRLAEATFVPAARAGDPAAGVEALVPPLLERLRTVPRAQPPKPSRLADIRVAAREIPRRARFVRGAWLAGVRPLRLLISGAAALFAALLAVMVARIGHCAALLGRRLATHAGLRPVEGAAVELTNSVLRLAQLAVVVFVMTVGTSFFFPGTGGFGGGGVDLFW
ncbi:MAG TPA: TPM domain-containing protein, partial [Thermoanaerobaculaceae bacterium]|nr:TPM domain-containing protein [Thermoanaerobaculaceae bacterium]